MSRFGFGSGTRILGLELRWELVSVLSMLMFFTVITMFTSTYQERQPRKTVAWSKKHHDKTIPSLLVIDYMLLISEYVLGKKLLSNFMKNLHKMLHKWLWNVTHQKTFLCLHFEVDHVISISNYDLENLRMLCQQKYWMKNIAVNIRFWFCSAFVYFADFLLYIL